MFSSKAALLVAILVQVQLDGFHCCFCPIIPWLCEPPATTTAAPTTTPAPGTFENCVCGKTGFRGSNRDDPKIVGGEDASKGDIPWQIFLDTFLVNTIITNSTYIYCGGSLLNGRWVLTAAHCTQGNNNQPNGIYVWVGLTSRSISSEGLNIQIKEYIHVAPACLPSQDEVPGQLALISGWGTLSSSGSQPTVLQKASSTIVSTASCNSAYSSYDITSKMMCASQSGIDTCQGDSGGPLMSKIGDNWELVGATSWGKGCALAAYPGVYADVRSEITWIKSIIGEECPRS